MKMCVKSTVEMLIKYKMLTLLVFSTAKFAHNRNFFCDKPFTSMVLFSILFLLCSLCILESYQFSVTRGQHLTRWRRKCVEQSKQANLDAKEVEQVLKSVGPMIDNLKPDSETYNILRNAEQSLSTEELHREYPYEGKGLPLLPDCNNYYSGSYKECFWHQNSDQVFVFVPVADDIERRSIYVKFEAKQVTITINGDEILSFPCAERIIPDGSFWIFETDKDGKKHILLDLEKRFRMINWKGVFEHKVPEDDVTTTAKRTEMLEKLFAANKGLSKVSGIPPETMQEMMKNGDLTRMIAEEVYSKPQVSSISEDGSECELLIENEDDGSIDEQEYLDLKKMDMRVQEGEGDDDVVDAEFN